MKKAHWLWLLGLLLLSAMAFLLWQAPSAPAGEMQRVWKGWRGENKHNEFALMRNFLASRGITLRVEKLGVLPQATDSTEEALLIGRDVFVDEEHQADKANLRAWVEAGGHLIVLANPSISEYFGFLYADEETFSPVESQAEFSWKIKQGISLQVKIETCFAIISKAYSNKKLPSFAEMQARLLRLHDYDALYGFEKNFGKGRLTILGHSEDIWSNDSGLSNNKPIDDKEYVPLAQADNAAYLHSLLAGQQKARLLLELKVQNSAPTFHWRLPELKWWAALVCALLGVCALLWCGGKRFGAVLEPNMRSGRDMRQHLFAAGQFWAQHKDYGYLWLAQQMRQRLLQDVAMLSAEDEDALYEQLASSSALTIAQIKQLLMSALPDNEQDFIDFVRIAEQLRTALGRTHGE